MDVDGNEPPDEAVGLEPLSPEELDRLLTPMSPELARAIAAVGAAVEGLEDPAERLRVLNTAYWVDGEVRFRRLRAVRPPSPEGGRSDT